MDSFLRFTQKPQTSFPIFSHIFMTFLCLFLFMIHQVIFMYINNKIYHMSLLACMLSVLLISIFLPYTQNSAPRPQKADSVYSFISPQEEEQTTILIDAGHGGYDGGSTSWDERVNEKDVTLQIALKTGALLEDLGYRIVYSRTDDNVSWPQDNAADLQARVDLGVEEEADYFISFHLNATDFYNDGARGFETYVTPGNDTAKIASAIHEQLAQLDYSIDRGINEADYTSLHVLALNPVPAMLLELGFITDDADLAKLCDESFQEEMASAIAAGIQETVEQ